MYQAVLLVPMLLGTTPAVYDSPATAARELAPQMQTGTLLVSEGDCLAVKVYTRSPYTHVGAVVVRNDVVLVYDSANGAGVRCQTLESYLAQYAGKQLHVLTPKRRMTSGEQQTFEAELRDHLGRPYSVKHHLSGERCEGLHCSEYVSDALLACRWIRVDRPSRVSPASLVSGLLKSSIYESPVTVGVGPVNGLRRSSESEPKSWCADLWQRTIACTSRSCGRMRSWFLCR